MWHCNVCGSNLLDTTAHCPICNRAAGSPDLIAEAPPAEPDARTKLWIWIVVGLLVPPLGILFLIMGAAYLLTPTNANATNQK